MSPWQTTMIRLAAALVGVGLWGNHVPHAAAGTGDKWVSGQHEQEFDGRAREFLLDVPDDLSPGAALLWVFHGYTGSAASMRESAGFHQLDTQQPFVVVYPQGTPDSRGNAFFNVGYEFHRNQRIDDLAFVRQLTDQLVTDLKLDRKAVFATGMSNGGDMSYLLASQRDPLVTAIAPIAGTMMQSTAQGFVPAGRISVLAAHGTQDRVTRWDGDPDNRDGWGPYPGVETVLRLWTAGLDLEKKTVKSTPDDDTAGSRIEFHHWTTSKDACEVRFYKFVGGGHDWPEHLGDPQCSTASEILQFFQSHLPPTANNATAKGPTAKSGKTSR